MNEQKNNRRGVFYGIIGIATLVVAVIGATFAYFTASASVNNQMSGDMATITFELDVTKVTTVDEEKGGMIPMSNSMVEAAVNNATPCVDNNGNAVCQIYMITATNTGSASLFLDGYVSLTGGSGVPTDFTSWTNLGDDDDKTTMRWAQVFVSGAKYTTVGRSTTGAGEITDDVDIKGVTSDWDTLAAPDTGSGEGLVVNSHNTGNIKTAFGDITSRGDISGSQYDIISRNYIRVSDHAEGNYTRTADVSSALVFNQYLDSASGTKPSENLYIVVWLSETGTNQTADSDGDHAFQSTDANENEKIDANEAGIDFFAGEVVFNSAQGSEVTATFSGFVSVRSNNAV